MGISPVMLRAAVRFFVRRTLFASKGDYYRILGLQANAPVADIERHYDLLMRLLRQDKQPGAAECVDRVGRAYEELMRLDDAPVKTGHKFHEPEDRAAAVLEALENPELTIDFSEEIKPKEQAKPLSAYIGANKESYIPDPRIARRRIHLLGQAAILGIGALVIVLGIFITQLEPSESLESKPAGSAADNRAEINNEANRNAAAANSVAGTGIDSGAVEEQKRLDLSFNDGSMESVTNSGGNPQVDPRSGVTAATAVKSNITETNVPESIVSETMEDEPVSRAPIAAAADQEPPVSIVAKADTAAANQKPIVLPTQRTTESVPVQEFKPSVPNTSSAQNEVVSPAGAAASSTGSILQQAAPVPVETGAGVAAAQSTGISAAAAQSTSKFTPVTVQEKAPVSATAQLNQFEGKEIPVLPKDTAAAASVASVSAASVLPEDGDEVTAAQAAPAVAKLEPAPAVTQSVNAITQPMLDQLLADFAIAFDTGNLNNLMAMFASSSRTNSQTTRQGIENEYRQLFSSTASRNMVLLATSWNNEGRFARGVGQYSAALVSQENAPVHVKGEYTLQLQLEGDKLKISRFYLSEDLPITRVKAAAGPSQTDLNALLSSFTEAYENGNINRLMTLFADNAQTNDQTTLAGIRQDHADLFNATEARQMFLKDVKWTINGNAASGQGNFEVMVQNKGQTSFATVKGSISLEAVKTANGVKLSKFFHKVTQ
jgi:hypothetical protein